MDKELRFGRMGPSTRGAIPKGRSKAKGSLCGPIRVIMMENFGRTTFTGTGFIIGMMGGGTRAHGRKIKWMGLL